jgi:Ca2+-binding EF-hand superfamily protein
VGSTKTLTGLDFNSFCDVLYSLDLHVFAKQHIFNLFGSKDDGLIDYRDFLSYLISLQSFDDDSIRLYFQLFDANGDDKLTIEEFQLVLGSMLQNNPPMGASDKPNSRAQVDLQQTEIDADDPYSICRQSSSELVRNSTDHFTELFQSESFEGGEIGFEDFKNWMKTRFVYIQNAFIPPTFILDNDRN